MSKTTFLNDFNTTDKLAKRSFEPIETMKVLKHNISIYWSWGVSRTVNLLNKGLLLSVNGNLHKGFVLITLDWDDTYTVTFLNKQYNEVKEQKTMVYFDVLVEIIDSEIERIPEYKY